MRSNWGSPSHNPVAIEAKKSWMILIVDDVQETETFAYRLRGVLLSYGFHVVPAKNEKEAIQYVKKASREKHRLLVVADLYMYTGIEEGIEIIERVRKEKTDVPIIVYSLYGHFVVNPEFYRDHVMRKYPDQQGYRYEELCLFHEKLNKMGIDDSHIFWKAYLRPEAEIIGVEAEIPKEDFLKYAKSPEELAQSIKEKFSEWVGE